MIISKRIVSSVLLTPFVVFSFAATVLLASSSVVLADGNDSLDVCLGTNDNVIGSIADKDSEVSYTVENDEIVTGVCIKSGSDSFEDSKHSGVLGNGTYEDCYTVSGVGTRTVTVIRIGEGPDCKAISHIDVVFEVDEEAPGYYFEFKKVWTGDEIDLEGVEVVFTFGENEWTPGDPAVAVEPGQVLEPLTEEVTGLPENCTYTSDLPESYTVFPERQNESASRSSIVIPQRYVDTLTVTNEVTCEEDQEEPGVVLGEVTKDPQVVVAPVGAVNAGTGSTAISAVAVAGLVASGIATGYAVVRTVKGE